MTRSEYFVSDSNLVWLEANGAVLRREFNESTMRTDTRNEKQEEMFELTTMIVRSLRGDVKETELVRNEYSVVSLSPSRYWRQPEPPEPCSPSTPPITKLPRPPTCLSHLYDPYLPVLNLMIYLPAFYV